MKKILILVFIILLSYSSAFANLSNVEYTAFCENNRFGLKDNNNNIKVKPKYSKLIRLGESSWIVQKNSKYGIMDSCGNYLVKPKYRHADRIAGKFVKLGNDLKYGVYDEKGEVFIPEEYSSIDIMFGGMFLTCKDFKYGLIDKNGKIVLENEYDEIYMPKPNIIRIRYNGKLYQIEEVNKKIITLPDDMNLIINNSEFDVTAFVTNPITASGYSAVTATDYILKLFASISPAHEATIDELILSQGADTVSILKRLSWLPKYPHTYIRNYYNYFASPYTGPLNDIKNTLKEKMTE